MDKTKTHIQCTYCGGVAQVLNAQGRTDIEATTELLELHRNVCRKDKPHTDERLFYDIEVPQ